MAFSMKNLKKFMLENWLIQSKVITLEDKWIGWWFLFANLNYVNTKNNYMQIYNKNNIETIAYKK